MADSQAVRARRYRRHSQGDHSLCRHRQESARPLSVVPDAGEVDPRSVLVRLVRRLEAAHEADPGNAMVARELRAAALALPASPGDDPGNLALRRAVMAQCGWDPGDDPELLDLGRSMVGLGTGDPLEDLRRLSDQVP